MGKTLDWGRGSTYETPAQCKREQKRRWRRAVTKARANKDLSSVVTGHYFLEYNTRVPVEGHSHVRVDYECHRDKTTTAGVRTGTSVTESDKSDIALALYLFRFVLHGFFGWVGFHGAGRKNRSQYGWAGWGFAIPLSLLILLCLKPLPPKQPEQTQDKDCDACGEKLAGSYCGKCGRTW